jgi:hypothetical protein
MMITVEHVIGNNEHIPVDKEDPVKVIENEESGEEEPAAPERGRNPCVQVVIIPRRRVVSDDRWALIVIIIVDNRWLCILRSRRRLCLGILPGRIRHHSKPNGGLNILQCA